MEIHKGFIVPEPAEANKCGVIHVEPKNGCDAYLEVQVFGNGPIFVFKDSLNAEETFALLHGASKRPDFIAGAVVGQAGYCVIPANPGILTVASDAESIGLIRVVEVRHCDCH
jgi:hypothetical protein